MCHSVGRMNGLVQPDDGSPDPWQTLCSHQCQFSAKWSANFTPASMHKPDGHIIARSNTLERHKSTHLPKAWTRDQLN